MESLKKRPRVGRPLIIGFIVLLGIIAVGLVGWNLYKYKFIKGKVKDAVYQQSNGLYTIRYDDMQLDEVGGNLHVTNLQVIPDTARYRQLITDKKNPPLLLSLLVPELTITGVKTADIMVNKKVSGRTLSIENATVLFYYARSYPDSSKEATRQEMYQQLLGNLNLIKVDSVQVNHVALSFVDIRRQETSIEASNISVHLQDVLIDSLHRNDSTRFFFAKKIQVSGDSGFIKNKPSTYFFKFEGMSFTNNAQPMQGDFTVKSLEIEPQLSEERYAAFSKVQKDRFHLHFKGVSINNIQLYNLMQSDIFADSLVVQQASVKIFRDRSYPGDGKSKIGQFPQQLLMKMPVFIALKKLLVNNAFIEYKEKNPASDYSGRVQFVNARAVISNITNLPSLIKRNNQCVINFNAGFLDLAKMHARLGLQLNDPKGRFTFSGGLDEGFDAPRLNKLIEPMGLAKIEKGRVNGLDFSFSAYDYGSNGRVTLLYDDLKLTLLKKDSAENKLQKKKLASFVANILIKNSNPTRNKAPRVESVQYTRLKDKSFFNLMWKSVFTGLKQSAGM